MSSSTPPLDAPPQNMFTAPITASAEGEDEDEWEYEYSIIETESFYVTLDLTTPSVPLKRRTRNPPSRKAGCWTNPGLGKQKRHTLPPPATYSAQVSGASSAPEKNAEIEAEDNDQEEEVEAPAAEEPAEIPSETPAARPTHVQILDLHSQNPMVSYDGHLYSCQWADNVGTEMLFKAHDPNDTSTPGIRKLPGDVDLVAMPSARIISQSVKLQPLTEANIRAQSRPHGNMKGLKIQVGVGALPKRKEQAAFLQKLAGLKEEKGEEDLVTIHTRARPKFKEWVQALRAKRARERKELVKIISTGDPRSDDVRGAEERIAEIDAEEERLCVEIDAKGLLPDGKRKAHDGDNRLKGRTNQGGLVPKTIRGPPQKLKPRKAPLVREDDDLSIGMESMSEESGLSSGEEEDAGSPGTEIGDVDGEGDLVMYY